MGEPEPQGICGGDGIMAFSGYLIKLIAANGTKTELPIKYIRYETYKCERNTMDLDPTRSLDGILHRNPLSHTAYKVEFDTPSMTGQELQTFLSIIRAKYRNTLAKDVYMEYYEPESDSYKTGHFYVPDISFQIRNVDAVNSKINYSQVRIAFIEY